MDAKTQQKKLEIYNENEMDEVLSSDDSFLDHSDDNALLNKHLSFSIIALKLVCIFVGISVLLCVLMSTPVLHLLPLGKEVVNFLLSYKAEIILLTMLPVLYFSSAKLIRSLQFHNLLLEQQQRDNQALVAVYQIITQVNHAILREHSQEQLLAKTCQIVQQHAPFSLVWAGVCEAGAQLPDLIVSEGTHDHYIQELLDSYAQSAALERHEPALAVLRKKHSVVMNDILSFSKNQQSWQKRALTNGFRAIAAFAVNINASPGLFAIYSTEVNAFSTEMVNLFRALATDLSLALSKIAQNEQQLHISHYDSATNLPNQALFMDRIQQAVAYATQNNKEIALAIVKPAINLEQNVLTDMANHLMLQVGQVDSVGLIGTNEIAVLLNNLAPDDDFIVKMNRLLTPFNVRSNAEDIVVTLQAGVALLPKDAQNSEQLIKCAKQALARTKADQENNCHFYSKEMTSELRNFIKIKNEINLALQQNEFVLYYQPIVELNHNKIVGLEVLTRWPNQKLGDVSPTQFISVAEQTDLVIPLGNWIIKTACEQFLQWQTKGHGNIFLCINISVKQLLSPLFIEELKNIFNSLKFDPLQSQLCFEIKESCLYNNFDKVKETICALKNMGIQLFLDDFTSDAHIMRTVHQLDIDALKIDAMTVRTIGKNKNTDHLLQGIVAYANGLNIQIIAEGVETQEQLNKLKQVGCQLAQGYCFSPPVKAKNIDALFMSPLN